MKRRDFFTSTALAGAAIPLCMTPMMASCSSGEKGAKKGSKIYSPEELGMYSFVDRAPDGMPLKAALIGNGSRGTGAASQFLEAGNALSIVALADVLEDRQTQCREILLEKFNNKIEDKNCFLGFDAYKKVMDLDIDVVLIATPTHFHPVQLKAAIDAGKHVFMEKPAAVDPVGIRTVMVAAKQAEAAGLSIVVGTQRHHQRDYWEALIQIRNGAIGDVLSATAHWNQGAWWNKAPRPQWSDMEYNIRNWFNIKWLSGDHLLDQGVHNIDVVTWLTGMVPEVATGFGGRARRLTGDIFDFFSVDYRYPNNKRMLATARQIDGCDSNVSESVMGTKGVLYTNDGIYIQNYEGETIWKYDYENKPFNNPYNQEHIHLVESIRLNKPINQAEELAISTMVAIQGREAAYTGRAISWDEIMGSDLRYGPTEYAMGPLPNYEEGVAPVPGKDPKAPM